MKGRTMAGSGPRTGRIRTRKFEIACSSSTLPFSYSSSGKGNRPRSGRGFSVEYCGIDARQPANPTAAERGQLYAQQQERRGEHQQSACERSEARISVLARVQRSRTGNTHSRRRTDFASGSSKVVEMSLQRGRYQSAIASLRCSARLTLPGSDLDRFWRRRRGRRRRGSCVGGNTRAGQPSSQCCRCSQ